ncbi:putative rwd domain-containing protein [Neofusicoccum parvum UCRNP2]|uniref:Putative rwd domain-containing protein n=1 Tax=Botryosphaeria parva (strain UCR-NP2) TaxID=1287680 RepID=R1G9V1_BOTPV|nr:putative rwd domain-containing protein [Neofusicoccum parvum UCRNP2]
MGREDQKEEREVLDSIFPDEITDISDTEYRVSITLDVENEPGDDSEPPTILLSVAYPDDYPDVAPRLDVSTPPNAPKHKFLDIQEDKARLLEALEPTVEENLGMAMVFTLVSTLKDSAELLIAERQKAAEALREAELQKAEEEENKKFHGSAVTRESFLEWRAKFIKEMEEAERRAQEVKEAEDKKKRGPKEEKKMTGRELWVKGLVGKVDEDDEDGDVVEGVDKMKIKA